MRLHEWKTHFAQATACGFGLGEVARFSTALPPPPTGCTAEREIAHVLQ